MLSPLQIKRVLKQCEAVNEGYQDWHAPGQGMVGDEGPPYFAMVRNQGWCEALRLVLETDTKSIRNTELEND